MGVEIRTQAFLDLYIPRGSRVYTPPATEDVTGNMAARQHFEEVAAQEGIMLAKIANHRFRG